MKCYIDPDPMRRLTKVFLVAHDDLAGKVRVLRFNGGEGSDEWVWDEYPQSEYIPQPSLVLPEQAVQALADELAGYRSPSAAQAEHLNDAREVRDRVLTMLEKERD